jgi:hypothetical protein
MQHRVIGEQRQGQPILRIVALRRAQLQRKAPVLAIVLPQDQAGAAMHRIAVRPVESRLLEAGVGIGGLVRAPAAQGVPALGQSRDDHGRSIGQKSDG